MSVRNTPIEQCFDIIYTNIRSLRNKTADLELEVQANPKVKVVCLTETMLDYNINDGELCMHSFNIFRKDRNAHGGGVAIYVHNSAIPSIIDITSSVEAVCLRISLSHFDLLLLCVYRPPHCSDNLELLALIKSTAQLASQLDIPLFICGDFNYPNIQWDLFTHSGQRALYDPFLACITELGLTQHVFSPTHIQGNILDLVFTDRVIIEDLTIAPPVLSDHSILTTSLNLQWKSCDSNSPELYYNFGKADLVRARGIFESHEALISDAIMNRDPIDKVYELFRKSLFDIRDNCVPSYKKCAQTSAPQWMNKSLKTAISKQRTMYNIMKKYPSEYNMNRYKISRRKNRYFSRQAKKSYFNRLLYKPLSCGNSKPFYKYLRSCRDNKANIIPHLKHDNKLITTPNGKANCLNDYFNSVFTIDDGANFSPNPPKNVSNKNLVITEDGVYKLLQELDVNKSCGPDGVTGHMLKTFSSIISPILTKLFSYSLETASVPSVWKLARVYPIHKKGSKQTPSNYRPISLTCIVCKILEHIISSHIHSLFSETNYLSDNQHGFRSQRSCETQLAHTVGHMAYLYDQKNTVDMIILDFSKAFDSVNHRKLFHKLENTGLDSQVIDWSKCFLSDRLQFVEVEGERSRCQSVRSGVPQGSVLGPLFFLIYINDLPPLIQSSCRLFADDAVIYNTSNNYTILENDLHVLEEWSKRWQMNFNVSKCAHLQIGPQVRENSFSLLGFRIKQVTSHLYLGIEIQSDLKWNKHIENIINVANQRLAFVFRVLKHADMPTRKIAYMSLVRPLLEYASPIWDPYQKTYVKKLEKIQNKALRRIYNISGLTSFSELRDKVGFPSLKKRREQARLNLFCRCAQIGIDPPFSCKTGDCHNTRQNSDTYLPHIRTNVF